MAEESLCMVMVTMSPCVVTACQCFTNKRNQPVFKMLTKPTAQSNGRGTDSQLVARRATNEMQASEYPLLGTVKDTFL